MPKVKQTGARIAARFPRLGLIPFTEMIPAMFSEFVQLPRLSECIQYCSPYLLYILMTLGVNWLTEQPTGRTHLQRGVQTHIFLSWFRNIYFTFLFFGSHGFQFHGLSSHSSGTTNLPMLLVFRILPKMVSGFLPSAKPNFMLLREKWQKVAAEESWHMSDSVNFKSERFYLMIDKWII